MKATLKTIRTKLREAIRAFLQIPPNYVGDNGCVRAAASFMTWNQVSGDYLEFGVWRGFSFATAWHEIQRQRGNHIRLGYDTPEYNEWKRSRPRFFAFDCFEGLPGGGAEARMVDYHPGSYLCSESEFRQNLTDRGVDLQDVVVVKGLYQDTCSPETRDRHALRKAAVVMIDCDLYSSTVPVLDFITPIVQQGTIIIFDDWFRFQANPDCGEQRACREWLVRNPHIQLVEFWRQCPQAVCFVVNIQDALNS